MKAPIVALALVLGLLGTTSSSYAQSPWNSVMLSWTTPGDDQQVGTVAGFDLRYSTAPINERTFRSAKRWTSMPAPAAPGTRQGVVVTDLLPSTTYFFAIKVRDDASNWSGISNMIAVTTDAAPQYSASRP